MGIECYAEFGFNLNKFAQIAAPVGGVIQEVSVDLGSKVTDKQTVARIWSAQIAEAVAKAVLTHQTLEREQKLRAQQVTSEKNLQEAEAAHRAACQGLRTFGFTEAQIDELSRKPEEAVLLDARAPFAGEITGRTAVRGALVEAGTPLFTIADRSLMWAELAVPEAALVTLEGRTGGRTDGGFAAGAQVQRQIDLDQRRVGRNHAHGAGPRRSAQSRRRCSRRGCSPRRGF